MESASSTEVAVVSPTARSASDFDLARPATRNELVLSAIGLLTWCLMLAV